MDLIHRTPGLDRLGLARCRAHNKLFSWKRDGACPVCGVKLGAAPPAPHRKKAARATRPATPPLAPKSRPKAPAKPRRSAKK